jgi:hypothetical protein
VISLRYIPYEEGIKLKLFKIMKKKGFLWRRKILEWFAQAGFARARLAQAGISAIVIIARLASLV